MRKTRDSSLADPSPGTQPATIGQRIRAVRTAWGWSQLRLAGALGLDQATVSFWEQDKVVPGGTSTVALAALFRASIGSLETGAGFVVPDPPSEQPPADPSCFRCVSLPSLAPGRLGLLDITDGTAKEADPSQSIFELTDALKEGRKIWMVLR